jgi:hypothetical protein
MDINNIFKKFINQMTLCSMNQRLSFKIIESQRENILNQYRNIIEKKEYDKPLFIDIMSFYLWENQKLFQYGKTETTLNSLFEHLIYYHNKLYQWNLSNAFEIYEGFLKEIVEYMRIMEKYNFKFDGKDNSASKILKKLRSILPEYKCLESNTIKEIPKEIIRELIYQFGKPILSIDEIIRKNRSKLIKRINNKFILKLIEEFRHKIIHCDGKIENKKEFLKKLLIDVGLYNDGNYNRDYEECLNLYFTMKNKPNEISLLEIKETEIISIDTLDNLLSVLNNSAYYIYKEIAKLTI